MHGDLRKDMRYSNRATGPIYTTEVLKKVADNLSIDYTDIPKKDNFRNTISDRILNYNYNKEASIEDKIKNLEHITCIRSKYEKG